jgi:branched-chain amino acid transport system ATP-binding protein
MLRLENVTVAYGKHEALHGVSLDVAAGATTVILGANGAGKTTLLKTIAGLTRPQPGGRILFEGRPIEAEPTHRMVGSGIALVPEGRRLFGQMTVIDNLRMGAYARHARAAEPHRLERVLAMFPRLAERRGQLASTMSGGEQQMVAIARALMSGPKLLLLDEPSLGLSPRLVKELFAILHTIKAHGQSVILVEQSVRQSLRLADFVYVLENGRIVRSGRPAEIEADRAVQKAYLGLAAGSAAAPAPRMPAPKMPAAAMPRPPARPAQALPAAAPVLAAGGFAHPYSRCVESAAQAAHSMSAPHEREGQTMERRSVSPGAGLVPIGTGGGFYHPFARSVAASGTVPTPLAAVPAQCIGPVRAPAVRTEAIPTTGGFVNPRAANPQARPDRL